MKSLFVRLVDRFDSLQGKWVEKLHVIKNKFMCTTAPVSYTMDDVQTWPILRASNGVDSGMTVRVPDDMLAGQKILLT